MSRKPKKKFKALEEALLQVEREMLELDNDIVAKERAASFEITGPAARMRLAEARCLETTQEQLRDERLHIIRVLAQDPVQ